MLGYSIGNSNYIYIICKKNFNKIEALLDVFLRVQSWLIIQCCMLGIRTQNEKVQQFEE